MQATVVLILSISVSKYDRSMTNAKENSKKYIHKYKANFLKEGR